MASDWLVHFLLLLKNGLRDLLRTLHKCSLWGPDHFLLLLCYFDPKSKLAAMATVWLTHFRLLLMNCCSDILKTCHKCSLWCPDQLLFPCCWLENQNGRTSLWLADTVSTSSQERLQMFLMLLPFIWIRNIRCPSLTPIGWHISDFFWKPVSGIYPKPLAQMFLMGSRPSVITYYVNLKYMMAALADIQEVAYLDILF